MSPHHDLDLGDGQKKQYFCVTLWLMMMHPHTKLGCKRLKLKYFKRYCPDKHSVKGFNLHLTWTLNTTKKSFLKTAWLMMIYHQGLVAKGSEVQKIETIIF